MHTQMGRVRIFTRITQMGSRGRGAEMHVPELPAARYTLKAISS